MIFCGAYTAIVTPFTEGGTHIDEAALRNLVDFQIESGISGIVAVGTTGESPTLTTEEHLRVIEICVNQSAKRVPIIAGCGSNSTAEAIELTKQATNLGCDGVLLVSPYYNRPPQRGLVAHFSAVAKSTPLPIMLYDIPSRTGVKLATSTIIEICHHNKNVLANKVATGNVVDVIELETARINGDLPEQFCILSGDDGLTLEFMRSGACGVVSVASNLFPKEISNMVSAETQGDSTTANAVNQQFLPLFTHLLSLDTNPIPIKAAMAMQGKCSNTLRLPLLALEEEKTATIADLLEQFQQSQ